MVPAANPKSVAPPLMTRLPPIVVEMFKAVELKYKAPVPVLVTVKVPPIVSNAPAKSIPPVVAVINGAFTVTFEKDCAKLVTTVLIEKLLLNSRVEPVFQVAKGADVAPPFSWKVPVLVKIKLVAVLVIVQKLALVNIPLTVVTLFVALYKPVGPVAPLIPLAFVKLNVPAIVAIFPAPEYATVRLRAFVVLPVRFNVVPVATLKAVEALESVTVAFPVEAGASVTLDPDVLTVILLKVTVGTLVMLIFPPVLKITASPVVGIPLGLQFNALFQVPDVGEPFPVQVYVIAAGVPVVVLALAVK